VAAVEVLVVVETLMVVTAGQDLLLLKYLIQE
jgi:hypothetical protein